MNARVSRLSLIACAALLLTGASQKQPPMPTLGETISVNIVNLDVVVTRRDGTRVHGLTKADFQILENGQPREISNFAEYTAETQQAEKRRAPEQSRTVVVFVERSRLPKFEAERFAQTLRGAVRRLVRRGDSAAVVLWNGRGQVSVDFTQDVETIDRLLASLPNDLGTGRPEERPELVRQADLEEIERQASTMRDESSGQGSTLSTTVATAPVATVVERFGDLETITEITRMKRRVNAINAAINGMAGAEGKKILLLATERLGEIGGGDRIYEERDDYFSQDFRAGVSGGNLVDSIVYNANAAGVTIYPVYPAGRPVRLTSGGYEYLTVTKEMASLAKVARETGGAEAVGMTEIVRLMERVEDDANDYYSLAYRIESARADRKRRIEVKTKDPKLIVRARRSYVEKSDHTRMRDRLMAALVRSTNDSMFSIEAQLGDARSVKQRRLGRVPLQVRIPIGALTVVPENGTNVGVFSVYVVSGAGGEETSALRRQTQRFEIPATDLARAVSGHFTYDVDLVLNHQADRVAVGVVDELSKSYAVARVTVR